MNLKGVRRTPDVAEHLGTSDAEALKQLRAAVREGLVYEDEDGSIKVPADFDPQYSRLADDGRHEWERLDEERSETKLEKYRN